MKDDEDFNKPKFTVLDFEKERSKLEDEQNDQDNFYAYILDLYSKNISAFQYIESEKNYELAMQKLREAFNHALSIVDLDGIEESIVGYEIELGSIEDIEIEIDEEDDEE